MSSLQRVVVHVPTTSANLGPGFDCLGLALQLYSRYMVEVLAPDEPTQVVIQPTWGEDASFAQLPTDAQNLVYQAFAARLGQRGRTVPSVRITAALGVPAGRGLGSSGMAIVAGLLAAETLAANVAPREQSGHAGAPLLDAAVALERGQHADNVAAALLGGLVVVARDHVRGAWQAVRVPVPANLRAVLFVPTFPMDTEAGRALLPEQYARGDAVHNVGHAALLLAALATGDMAALGAALDDRFHEPYRAQLFPQFPELVGAARAAGAHGACLSGGGSSILALATDRVQAVADGLARAAAALHIEGRVVITDIDRQGAVVKSAAAEADRTDEERAMIQRAAYAGSPACLVCLCGKERGDLRRTDYRCACGQPLDVEMGAAVAQRTGTEWREIFDMRLGRLEASDRSGVWRFRDVILPFPEIAPLARPEGQTNLYPVGRAEGGGWARVGAFAGVERLWLKHEGENPTGSFKDRGMTVGISVACWLGATAVACASTGNTSASMAAYAAQAGLRAIVLLPAGKVAAGKLGQAIAYGAEIRQIPGDFDAAMADVERLCLEQGIYLLNSLNPFRILGQQSLAFEIAQQFGWDVPDWIALPAGNLGNTSALGQGLLRARDLGLIARVPRIAAIQAAGANPFYQSYLDGFTSFSSVKAQTIATAINIGNPVSYRRARAVIEATRGVVAQVTDDAILAAKVAIDSIGIGCEPASAASVAGVRQLVAEGIIRSDERVVAILTGNLLKDPDAILLAQRAIGQGERFAMPMRKGDQA